MQFTYYAQLEPNPDGGYLATFVDVPEALAEGPTKQTALNEAANALSQALRFYPIEGQAMPVPKSRQGYAVNLSIQDSLKLATLDAFVASGISKTELAARLGKSEGEARRILDPDHATKAPMLDAALLALGKRVVVSVEAA